MSLFPFPKDKVQHREEEHLSTLGDGHLLSLHLQVGKVKRVLNAWRLSQEHRKGGLLGFLCTGR